MFFEGRALKRYGDFVPSAQLVEGRVYFRVSYFDQDTVIPELVPLVFIGRDLHAEQPGLYFQDAGSYMAADGIDRGALASAGLSVNDIDTSSDAKPHGWREVMEASEFARVCEFEAALEMLLACSLRRRTWDGVVRPITPVPDKV